MATVMAIRNFSENILTGQVNTDIRINVNGVRLLPFRAVPVTLVKQ